MYKAWSLFDKCLLRFALHWCLRGVPCSTSVYCASFCIGVWGVFPVRQVSIVLRRSTLGSEAWSLFDKCLLHYALHWCLRRIPCSTSVYCASLYNGFWGVFPVRQVSIVLRLYIGVWRMFPVRQMSIALCSI
jgi:hypothetical protein